MSAMSGMAMSSSRPPLWVQVVTVGFVVLLGVAAGAWVLRAVRPAPVPVLAATASTPESAVRPGPARLTGPRVDAGCHVLMSLGMAGMLLAML